jgi:hypothetical protein
MGELERSIEKVGEKEFSEMKGCLIAIIPQ